MPQARGLHVAIHLYHRSYAKCHPSGPFPCWEHTRQRATRIEHLEAAVAASLCEEYRAELQPDGSILLVPEDYSRPTDTTPDVKSEALRVLWRMRSSQMSRRDMAYLLPDLDSTVSWADVAPWLKHLSQPASRRVCILEGEYEMQGAYCNIAERLALLYEARAVRTPEALQPGAQRNTWVTIGVDGTNRWNRAYVHCAVAAPGCGPTQLASWWLFEGSEMWATVYSMQSECDFDTQLRAATALQLPHADGVARSPLFFVRADGKAHIMLAGGDGFTKKRPGAMVCHCCGANSATVLRKFGGQEVALEGIKGHVRLTGVFRDIPADRRIPDFGAHGVMRVAFPGVNGIVRGLVTHGGVSRKNAATMVQGVVNGARKVARTVHPGKWGADKANAKGQVRMELGAAAHFVKARMWGPLLQLVAPVIGNHQVGGRPWLDVCTEWWEAFAAMAELAWKDDFLSGAEQRALLQRQRTMGAWHLDLGWGKTLWTHMWVDHMYAYVARWGTIARLGCFALEGSHVRLKRLLRNSGGVSLLNDRSGLQCVVDNHTLDDNLRKGGWELQSRAVTKQKGFQRRPPQPPPNLPPRLLGPQHPRGGRHGVPRLPTPPHPLAHRRSRPGTGARPPRHHRPPPPLPPRAPRSAAPHRLTDPLRSLPYVVVACDGSQEGSRLVIRVATRDGFAHSFSTEEGGNQGDRFAQLHY